ncbi:uncharacterized protein LOC119737657 [Patiria miniata]|uniref:Uncharacterized protein n=1 Tax=Patiria miniata TaxID=46514 RepID=A0A914AVE9_PATMI|nr:uncharacterized protein LOC119737657 [Patiria miniata]
MDQQLNAIEESAANIEQDFRNTSLMLHTVENLTDAMAPGDTRPKADYSLRDYRLPDHTDADSPGTLDAQVHDDSMRSQDSRQAEEQQEDDKDVAGMVTTVTDDEGNQTGIERAEDTALTLGISGISGVSDIIAEVIADGDASDVLKMGISTQQQKAARKKMEQRRMTEQPGVEDYTRLSSDQIRELLTTPRTPRQDEDEDDRWPSRRKPAERSDKERKELKDWAVTKRAKSLAEYKKQREELIERELRPFHPKAGESMGPSSLKEIKKQEGERGRKKKDMIESSHDERVQQAKALMAEMFTEKPQLPTEEAPASTTKRKDRTLRDSGASEMSSRLDKRPTSQIPKGTYLFVDSEAYKPRPQARSQGGVDGRADSRASRGEDFGYSLEREDEELVGGRWTGRLRSEERGARGPTSSRDLNRRNQETRESNDWRILEGITEFTDDDQISAESRAKTEPAKLYRPKPFDQVVRVQRPEVTRKQPVSVRTQKTYTEMLQEMKGETGGKKTSSQTLRAKQRLYGTKRIPGSSKAADSTTPRFTKTYSERLSDMQQKSGGMTRLRPRTRPKGVPRINTGTLTLGTFDDTPYRRQQVEGRGLHPEPTPRSSTPYHERLGTLSLSGTYRGRDDVVSPAPKVGVKYKPRDREPMTYVEQLQRLSSEAPRTHRHKTAYVGPVQRETYKSPRLHSPMARHRPYPRQGQRSPGVEEFDERSGFSDLSSWNVSDEVMDILHRRDSFEGDVGAVTDDDVSIEGLEYDDYTTSVNIRELEEIASVSSGSVLSNIDWGAVDKMIADVR